MESNIMRFMQTFLLFVFLQVLLSCNKINSKSKNLFSNQVLQSKDTVVKDLNNSDSLLPNRRFGKSEIINPKFEKKLILGVWTKSYEDPSCVFEINENSLLLCDYDGDGERLYKIIGDSIFLDNPHTIFQGRIIDATGNKLIIHWQENESPETLLRWRE
jgi:hypothetical protein